MRVKPQAEGMEEFEVPSERLLAVAGPKKSASPSSLPEIVKRALENPIGSKRLEEEAKGTQTVALVVDDHTRRTPVAEIAPLVLERLFHAGLKPEQIKVFVALGTHRPMTEGELRRRLGKVLDAGVEVVQHDCDGPSVDLGRGPNGSCLALSAKVAECDLIVGIGHIAPHRIPGFTGGAKMLLPGVAARRSVDETHWLAALYEGAEITGIRDNPVREDIDAAAKALGKRVLKLDVIFDGEGKVVDAVFGDVVEAHREGARRCLPWCEVWLPEPADIVVVDAHPTTLDMWQAAKAVYGAEAAVKPGGVIVLLAPCPEGIARDHPEVEKFGYRPFEEVRRLLERGEIRDLAAAAHLAHMGRITPTKARCILVSRGIGPEGARALGWEWAPSPQEGLEKAFSIQGRGATVAAILSAGEALAKVGKRGTRG